MFWNNIFPEIYESKAYIDYLVNKWSSFGSELMLQNLVCFSQTDNSFHMDPLGSYDPIPHNRLCWQLVDSSHGSWGVDLNIMSGKKVLNHYAWNASILLLYIRHIQLRTRFYSRNRL